MTIATKLLVLFSKMEHVFNGTFNNSSSGWAPLNSATLTWEATSGGRLNVTPLAAQSYGAATQTMAVPLLVGRTYTLKFDATSTAATQVQVNGQVVAGNATRNGTGFQATFVASGTDATVILLASNSTGIPAYFDNVSVR